MCEAIIKYVCSSNQICLQLIKLDYSIAWLCAKYKKYAWAILRSWLVYQQSITLLTFMCAKTCTVLLNNVTKTWQHLVILSCSCASNFWCCLK